MKKLKKYSSEVPHNVNNKYNKLLKRYETSFSLMVFLSVSAFFLSAVLVILNLFAIRMNPAKVISDPALRNEQWYFIAIVIITTISGAISGVLSLFTFKKKAKIKVKMIERIRKEINNYKNEEAQYSKTQKDKIFIDNIKEILEMEK